METRTITQVKIYKLLLNPMHGRYEDANLVAIAYDKNDLMKWYESLKVEPYKDGNWHKTFKQGSELEHYNPIESETYHGIREEWTQEGDVDAYIKRAEDSYGIMTVPVLINQ